MNRLTLDQAADPDDWADVDGSVRGIATVYNARGQVASVTSWGGADDDGTLD